MSTTITGPTSTTSHHHASSTTATRLVLKHVSRFRFVYVAGGLVSLAAVCMFPLLYIEFQDLYHAPAERPLLLTSGSSSSSSSSSGAAGVVGGEARKSLDSDKDGGEQKITRKQQDAVVSVHQVVQAGKIQRQEQKQEKPQEQVEEQPKPNLRQVAAAVEPVTTSKITTNSNTQVIRKLSDITIWDDPVKEAQKPLARGVAGRPMDQTPALQGAKRAHIECDVNVDSLAYWNDPVGTYDENFVNPFRVPPEKGEKFITFGSDQGGWNNIRMSMEIIFVMAAVTGRTLVLPPKEPLYLLLLDKEARHRGFADFFPIHTAQFQSRVKVITMKDFLTQQDGKALHIPQDDESARDAIWAAADHCDHFKASPNWCIPLTEFLKLSGTNPNITAEDHCVVFDEVQFQKDSDGANTDIDPETQAHVAATCGEGRQTFYWHQGMNEPDILHFRADHRDFRLLTHFYAMIHFTNPAYDHHFKRFVRDFLHYHDSIYCAAGKIVKAIQQEGIARGFPVDPLTGAGGYSALHVRRGDLQYKQVKIPAEEWYENTKELWQPNEILYVATDEKNKTFFNPLAEHYSLRYLGDYWDLANLSSLDPNYMGMIDTIIASRGRVFAGTFFSTFTGYINRLRGYHGMSMMDSWYAHLPRKTFLHKWDVVAGAAYAYEWPDGWQGIDADTWPSRDVF